MTRDDIFAYVMRKYGVSPDYPFDKDFKSAVMRHSGNGKWFALIMPVRADRLGHESSGYVDVVTVKSEPMLIDSFIAHEGFHRAYHMNKTMWLTIELIDAVPDEKIKDLIGMSYDMTDVKKKKRS
jgi:predicted DNA-binding protein (MmcQ/YjbR family)